MNRVIAVIVSCMFLFSLASFVIAESDDSDDSDEFVEEYIEEYWAADYNSSVNATMNASVELYRNKTLRDEMKDVRDQYKDDRKRIRDEAKQNLTHLREEYKDKMLEFRRMIKEGNASFKINNSEIKIHELTDEQKEIIAGRINAKTGLNLTAEDINGTLGHILRVYLSNGAHAEVKVMPDRASEVALKRLRAKCEERNCSVELKEVGYGPNNRTRVAYEVKTEKDARILFIFGKKMFVSAQVDAETGDVLVVKKPWWAFMAKEKNALDAEIEAEVEAETD
jgi:hypothetical protein